MTASGTPGSATDALFSGAMDEFCLFNRALSSGEIRALYAQGRPQGESVATR